MVKLHGARRPSLKFQKEDHGLLVLWACRVYGVASVAFRFAFASFRNLKPETAVLGLVCRVTLIPGTTSWSALSHALDGLGS